MNANPKKGKPFLAALRLALPWLIAGGIFYYLFTKVPPGKVWETLRYIPLPTFFAFSLVYFLVILLLDNWTLARVLSRFAVPVTFRQLLPGRLVSFLVAILNYNAGQAALAAYLRKTRQASFFKTLGAIFFLSVIDLYWVIGLAFVGSFFYTKQIGEFDFSSWVQRMGYVSLAAIILHLAFWRGWFARIIPKRLHFGFGDWLRGKHLFQAFHHATVLDYLKAALLRMPIHLFIVASEWVLIRIFQAEISWQKIMATVPAIFLLGAIPATPGGLGTVQVATVELLKDQITLRPSLPPNIRPEDILFAMTLAWMFVNYLLKAAVGAMVLIKTSSSLFKAPIADDAAGHSA